MIKYKGKSILHRLASRNRTNKLFYKGLELSGNTLENKKWVFILGCYNSGTTLLNQILANHPQISGLPDEGVMLTSELLKPEDFGWRRMWSECYDQLKTGQDTTPKTAQKIKKHWSHFYKSKPYLVEKSISNVCRVSFLNEQFQPAYFIHIVRNGYAVSEGIQRKAKIISGNEYEKQEKYPIEVCAKQWVDTLDVFEKEKENLKNVFEITYEEFTEDPDRLMKEITTFLGLEGFNNKLSERSFSVHEKSSEIKNMNSRSLSKLSEVDIEKINSVASEHLKKYNYKVL
ncbi:sulfotransferase [Gramella lutea]|uniref:Sulfotransferase n=1 Tax=Christiangramia lutea TaxID=1607951 RepID=A0A9X1V449_9FLAO|nr:sulfotransferase [Christiangramia lutea]MCH4823803.1 sulfotransferase [Christiangramia lutea]